jgi:hypothetical protein
MKAHELVDVATITASALLLRDAKFFARSLDSRPLVETAAESEAVVDDVGRAGERVGSVDTPVGAFEAAYLPWQWLGPDHPTLVYHHGSGERPFDFGRFSSNSFRRLFVAADEAVPANVVAVRAPFHDGSKHDRAGLRSSVSHVRRSTYRTMETRTGDRRTTVSATLPSGSGESSSRPWLPMTM